MARHGMAQRLLTWDMEARAGVFDGTALWNAKTNTFSMNGFSFGKIELTSKTFLCSSAQAAILVSSSNGEKHKAGEL